MTWLITIDQRTPSGSTERHGPYDQPDRHLVGAIEDALSFAGLDIAEVGSYQITATRGTQ